MVRYKEQSTQPEASVTVSRQGMLIGMRRLLPVCLFVVPFGIAFGVAAVEQGLGPFQTTAMSALVFTATAQFAALDFLSEPVAFLSLFLVVLALSGRHVVMSAALAPWINRLPLAQRMLSVALLSDANFADAHPHLQSGETDFGQFIGAGLMLWSTWVVSTALGAYGGDLFGNLDAFGAGAVMLCFFAATVVGMLRRSHGLILPTILAMAISVLTVSLLPMGWNIILAALVGGALSVVIRYD